MKKATSKKATAKKQAASAGPTASQQITKQIAELTDWRGKRLARLRQLIQDAAPGMTEDWKWGTAVWSNNGNVLAAGAFKDHLKLNFFKGAAVNDPKGLFNAGLDAKTSRAIDIKGEAPAHQRAFLERATVGWCFAPTTVE